MLRAGDVAQQQSTHLSMCEALGERSAFEAEDVLGPGVSMRNQPKTEDIPKWHLSSFICITPSTLKAFFFYEGVFKMECRV